MYLLKLEKTETMKNLIFALIFEKISLNMRKSLSLAIAFICILMAGKAQNIQEGIKQLENENFTAALATFNKLAVSDPKNPIYYYYIGEVYYNLDKKSEARKAYDKGLSISSKCDQCHIGLGRLDIDENKPDAAKKHFETALKGNSKNHQIQAFVGAAYLYNTKPNAEAALKYLSLARDLNPKQSKYWIYLGDAYQAKGDLGNSMTSYETAIEKDVNDPEIYVKMARIWASGQQVDLATQRLENAIKIKPDYALAYKDLYELYIRTRKFEKVVPILEKYVALSGSDVDAKVRLVKFLCYTAKDYNRAIEEGTKIISSNPEQYTIHRWLAWSYFEVNDAKNSLNQSYLLFNSISKDTNERKSYPSDYEFAAKAAAKLNLMDTAALFYNKVIELQPERRLEITGLLAKAFYDAKKFEKAEFWYLEKATQAPLTVSELVYLGLTQKNQNKLLKADSTYATVLTMSPKYDFGWLTRAQINNLMDTSTTKKLYLAKPFYEKYIELASVDPVKNKIKLIDAYTYLAVYNVQISDYEMAKNYYNLVLSLDPNDEKANSDLKILNGIKK